MLESTALKAFVDHGRPSPLRPVDPHPPDCNHQQRNRWPSSTNFTPGGMGMLFSPLHRVVMQLRLLPVIPNQDVANGQAWHTGLGSLGLLTSLGPTGRVTLGP